jgi:hypothetical protein
LQATITLEYGNARTAASVAMAISPDNSTTPKGLSVKTTHQGKLVVTEIILEERIATLISTVDDLLEGATTAEKALHVVNEKRI